jgi:hypothetical protein
MTFARTVGVCLSTAQGAMEEIRNLIPRNIARNRHAIDQLFHGRGLRRLLVARFRRRKLLIPKVAQGGLNQ